MRQHTFQRITFSTPRRGHGGPAPKSERAGAGACAGVRGACEHLLAPSLRVRAKCQFSIRGLEVPYRGRQVRVD